MTDDPIMIRQDSAKRLAIAYQAFCDANILKPTLPSRAVDLLEAQEACGIELISEEAVNHILDVAFVQ